MGYLYYGNSTEPIEIPDRVLAHLKVVAATKLRRSESFTVSWNKAEDSEARTTIWLQAAIPLRFELGRTEPIDRRYLEEMAQAATSSAGVFVDLAAEATASQPVADLRRVA
ncbi:hypothetical protein [Microbacterium sp. T2.11-28]|uniref:DUF7882 family protein n=1 Tax=unclassified Microbacterium TaxID=2609290 RepID=UPI002477A2D1|nr:hypothetical protein [Microbacterium sp. T2.11-28]CAI9387036.1 hypothetical protein MICABA_00730 [Microbacterium sp. T2.11-28]